MTLVLLFYLLFISACSAPELLNISNKNQCIRSIVDTFVTDHTCQALSQTVKSEVIILLSSWPSKLPTVCSFKWGNLRSLVNLQTTAS